MVVCTVVGMRLCVISIILTTFPRGAFLSEDNSDQELRIVLTAIEKLLKYYKSSYPELNLDGIFGLRLIEGQALLLAKDLSDEKLKYLKILPKEYPRIIKDIRDVSGELANLSLPYLQQKDEYYFSSMQKVIEAPFDVFYPHKFVDTSLEWTVSQSVASARCKATFTEPFSDDCMSQLQGTGKYSEPCSMTDECLKTMMCPGLHSYQALHQVIYVMLAWKMGCGPAVDKWLESHDDIGKDSLAVAHAVCSNVYIDLLQYIKEQSIDFIQDEFMEVETICPLMGYMEFLSMDFLRKIVSWQMNSGCFGESINGPVEGPADVRANENGGFPDVGRRKRDIIRSGIHHVTDGDGYQPVQFQSKQRVPGARSLMKEERVSGGCYSHRTAVGAGALATYLRYIVDPGPEEFSHLKVQVKDEAAQPNDILNKLKDLKAVSLNKREAEQRSLVIATKNNAGDRLFPAEHYVVDNFHFDESSVSKMGVVTCIFIMLLIIYVIWRRRGRVVRYLLRISIVR